MRFVLVIGVLLVLLLSSQPGWAQESRGSIVGRVTDSSGAVIPGVAVRLTHVATGVVRTAATNAQGNYSAPLLPGGIYEITAEKGGFKRFVRGGIELRLNDDVEVNISLEVGAQTESVTVTAETPLLDTVSGSIGQVVETKSLSELPMGMGLSYNLIRLSPGVIGGSNNTSQDQPWEPGASVNYAMSGSDAKSAAITMDGADNSQRDGSNVIMPNFVPPSDAVAEMKIQTATFDGTVGQSTGGLINVSLKSGTNALHGTAYYSFIRTSMTANTFFGNKANLARPDSGNNRWGGVVSGPIWIPKVFNGKNKTFFMFAYEGIHYASQRATNYTVPTAAQRTGDLSQLLAIGPQYQLYNPFSARSIAGGRIQRDPIAGNIVSSVKPVSSIATKLMDPANYPLPLNAGTTVDGANNLPEPDATQHVNFYSLTARADHNFSDKHRMFGRVNKYKAQFADPQFFGPTSIYSGTHFWYYMSGFNVDDVYMLSPTFIMNTRVSDGQYIRAQDSNPLGLGIDLTQAYGFPAAYNNLFPDTIRRTPSIGLSDFSGFSGSSYTSLWQPQETRALAVAFDKIKGSHGLKFGFEYRQYRQNRYSNGGDTAGGTFTFNETYTNGPFDNSTNPPRGGGLAAFLLDVPTSGSFSTVDSLAEQSTLWAGYIQDDWKATRKLTLNLSLRYELEGPLTERYNRSIRDFNPTATHSGNFDALALAAYAANPIAERPVSTWSTLGGMEYAGVNGVPRELFNRDTNNFMPRIGFAYALGTKTVVRGGFGYYFGPLGLRRGDAIQTNYNQTTNLVATENSGLSFIANMANAYPNGVLTPRQNTLGADTYLGQALSYFTPDAQAPRTRKYQVSVQRQLSNKFLVEVGTIGSFGDQLQITRDPHLFPSQYLSTSPARDQPVINYWTGNVSSPFAGLVPGTGMNGSTIQRQALVRNIPQFANFTGSNGDWTNLGSSNYFAGTARVERRFSQGFSFQFAYTFSKQMQSTSFLNPGDLSPEYVISGNDRPHQFTASYIYELPFGRGRKFGSHMHPVANVLLGGWQVSGIWTAQSGTPLGFGDAIYYGGNIADVALGVNEHTWAQWFDTSNFEKASTKQLDYHYRTLSSRFSAIRGPRENYWDMAAIKNTKINEKMSFQFRFDAINAFNQVYLSGPNTTPSNTSFGQITAQTSIPRRAQIAMKFIF